MEPDIDIWAWSRENCFKDFQNQKGPNRSVKVHRLAKILKLHMYTAIKLKYTFKKANNKGADQTAWRIHTV